MTNIASTLEGRLDALSLRQLRRICDAAQAHGLPAYLVGGAVRDALLQLPVGDMDIVVVGLTPEFVSSAAEAINARIDARSQFDTFALNADGRRIDIAMAREETYAHPGALPTVSPGALEDDLARRDFTINAMAASINARSFGALLDPFDGQADLRRRIVRVLHDSSFQDDATRILRAVRYAVRLDLTLDSRTERLIRQDMKCMDAVSGARMRDEFQRLLKESKAAAMLRMAHELGALQAIHPALTLDSQARNALRRAEELQLADRHSLYLAILSHASDSRGKEELIRRLALSARSAKVVRDMGFVNGRLSELQGMLANSEIYMRLKSFDESAILACALLHHGGAAARSMTLFLDELRHIKPALNGNDLIKLGVPQGPKIGELLGALLVARLDDERQSVEDELNFISERM